MRYLVAVRGTRYEVQVKGDRVTVDGVEHRAELRSFEGSARSVLVLDGSAIPLTIEAGGNGSWYASVQGERHEVQVLDERLGIARRTASHRAAPAGPVALKAPMPGLVVRVMVEPGQAVEAGTSLVVLEAMKMENELKAAGRGTVDRVAVRPGQKVEKGELLVTLR